MMNMYQSNYRWEGVHSVVLGAHSIFKDNDDDNESSNETLKRIVDVADKIDHHLFPFDNAFYDISLVKV